MDIDRTKKEIQFEHPMEEILDIEPGTTITTRTERTTDMVEAEQYDNKDSEIEEQFQEVYDAAMSAFESQCDEAEVVEGKYKARNAEVAVQFLNAALSAAKEKGSLKQHKDKLSTAVAKSTGDTTNNNILVADRNELLKHFGVIGNDPVSEQ